MDNANSAGRPTQRNAEDPGAGLSFLLRYSSGLNRSDVFFEKIEQAMRRAGQSPLDDRCDDSAGMLESISPAECGNDREAAGNDPGPAENAAAAAAAKVAESPARSPARARACARTRSQRDFCK